MSPPALTKRRTPARPGPQRRRRRPAHAWLTAVGNGYGIALAAAVWTSQAARHRLCGRQDLLSAAQMAAHVAGEIDPDAPLREAPLSVAALEAVTIPAADDRLQRQVG